MSFDYLRVDDTLAINADQIERYSGDEGKLDPGLLDAALFRPQTGCYPTLIDEAAALRESLSQNHPFVDGNKRTAFASTYVFFAINLLDITATDAETQNFGLGICDTSRAAFENMRGWLRDNTKVL